MGLSLCVKERHSPVLIVEEDAQDPWPLAEMQQLCLPCTRPVLTAPPQTDGPIAVLWTQRDHSLSAHRLPSHAHIPCSLVSHVHLPVVPPGGETLCIRKWAPVMKGGPCRSQRGKKPERVRTRFVFTLVARTHGAVSKRSAESTKFCSTSPSHTFLPSSDKTNQGLAVLGSS